MEKVKVELEVPAHAQKFAASLAEFVKQAKAAAADGWQPGTDIPAYLAATLTSLVPAAAELPSVKDEAKESGFGVGLAVEIELYKVL